MSAARRSAPKRSRRPRRKVVGVAIAASACAALLAYGAVRTFSWVGLPRAGAGRQVALEWPADAGIGVERLAAAGIVDSPVLFRALLLVTSALVSPVPGEHFLRDDLSPAEVLRRLARLTSRERAKLLVPEGENRFQVARRLAGLGVCAEAAFERAATDRAELERLGVSAPSAEGYLFPATYELFADTDAGAVLKTLVTETRKRLDALREKHAARFDALAEQHDWGDHEILALASVVEEEAAREEELPVIASVFMNRLTSATFKPSRMLQSDPTAAYGCLLSPGLPSCQGYAGRVLPSMLRDPQNPYNTYRNPGLPPGPIASPGVAAIEAVLVPARTDYLYFVATGGGRHTFSRTLEEHQSAIPR